MERCMSYDDVAWEKSDEIEAAWKSKMLKQENLREIGGFIAKNRSGVPEFLHRPKTGAFNVIAKMDFADGSAIIRFPIPGSCMFPEEKTRYEVAVTRFIQDKTAIPVPFVLHRGTAKEGPGDFGPFMLMDYNEHLEDACDALNTPGLTRDDIPILDPNISNGKLEKDSGPFKLWCDDLRPSNTLLNSELEVVAVIDWEFTYAAPVEFTYAPPWWLLLGCPESWEGGFDSWIREYEPRLKTFLKVMREREDAHIESGRLQEDQRLSDKMQRSWDSGDFWVTYAARNSFVFDAIFWKVLDKRFFGPGGGWDGWKSRISLLDENEVLGMEAFVDRKMEEAKERTLQGWEPFEEILTDITDATDSDISHTGTS
ncbi:phosphotransferase [Phlyctema vagabunda]|uniref:Phosphotransferase n=1 Tax=Phlyctema vagabunda TaxID=108571 RepID=A0ABR4PDZ7_9HELO